MKKRKKKKSKTPGKDRTKNKPTQKNPKTALQINSEYHRVNPISGYQEWLNNFKKLDFGPVRRK